MTVLSSYIITILHYFLPFSVGLNVPTIIKINLNLRREILDFQGLSQMLQSAPCRRPRGPPRLSQHRSPPARARSCHWRPTSPASPWLFLGLFFSCAQPSDQVFASFTPDPGWGPWLLGVHSWDTSDEVTNFPCICHGPWPLCGRACRGQRDH